MSPGREEPCVLPAAVPFSNRRDSFLVPTGEADLHRRAWQTPKELPAWRVGAKLQEWGFSKKDRRRC